MTDTEELYALLDLQGQHGNWDYSPYMMGLYNGIELCIATIENRPPEYKEIPKEWGENMIVVRKK